MFSLAPKSTKENAWSLMIEAVAFPARFLQSISWRAVPVDFDSRKIMTKKFIKSVRKHETEQ